MFHPWSRLPKEVVSAIRTENTLLADLVFRYSNAVIAHHLDNIDAELKHDAERLSVLSIIPDVTLRPSGAD